LYFRSQKQASDHSPEKAAKKSRFCSDFHTFTGKSGDFKKNKKNACKRAKNCDIMFETLQLGDRKFKRM
jgi:hypothetical protein